LDYDCIIIIIIIIIIFSFLFFTYFSFVYFVYDFMIIKKTTELYDRNFLVRAIYKDFTSLSLPH